MAVLIRDMEMPINCGRCFCGNDWNRFCKLAEKYIPMLGKPDWCPLIEIPEPKSDTKLLEEAGFEL